MLETAGRDARAYRWNCTMGQGNTEKVCCGRRQKKLIVSFLMTTFSIGKTLYLPESIRAAIPVNMSEESLEPARVWGFSANLCACTDSVYSAVRQRLLHDLF